MSTKNTDLSVIIITYNEAIHIRRCLESIVVLTDKIFMVDSFSTDDTVSIASEFGVTVMQNRFVNHAAQVNWALEHCNITTGWVMRLDADEFILPELCEEIRAAIPELDKDVNGVYLKRRVYFCGRWIKHGTSYPIWLLRLWRNGKVICEQRLMDEHMKLTGGSTVRFENDFVDENKNNLTAWTAKHNSYATKEAIELLYLKFNLSNGETIKATPWGSQDQRKRWLKKCYATLPLFLRPVLYFIYRYFIMLGFLDAKQGLVWHFLQGFWYRFLVDAKLMELESRMRESGDDPRNVVRNMYGLDT